MSRDSDFNKWNRLDWWEWNIEKMQKLRKGKLSNPASIESVKKFTQIYEYVDKTGLKIGTKIRYSHLGKEIIGYIEEPLLSRGEFVSNIERTKFSGENSWANYIIKYVSLDKVEILEVA